MYSGVIASLSLIVLAQAVNAHTDLYQYTRQCKQNTELCINLKCSQTQVYAARVPFSYHYLCCNGKTDVLSIGLCNFNNKVKMIDESY